MAATSYAMPRNLRISAGVADEKDFVLFVSTIEGRKNHDLAFAAWQRLRAELGNEAPRLLLVGRVGWRVEGFIEALHEFKFLDGLIEIKNDVSDEQLALLYSRCLFTIFPSLYEGLGPPRWRDLIFWESMRRLQIHVDPRSCPWMRYISRSPRFRTFSTLRFESSLKTNLIFAQWKER